MAQVIAVRQAVAAGIHDRFSGSPVWLWSLGFLVLLFFNFRSVRNFGSIEYWFALIKVVAIVAFILLGRAIFNLWTSPSAYIILPVPAASCRGFGGVWMAVIVEYSTASR